LDRSGRAYRARMPPGAPSDKLCRTPARSAPHAQAQIHRLRGAAQPSRHRVYRLPTEIEELQNRNFDRLLEEIRTDPSLRFSVDGVGPAEQKEFLGRLLHAKGQSCHAPGCNLRFSIINSIAWTGPYACWPMLPGNTRLC